MLEHGGGLRRAAEQYGIPSENWTDLSTGINPIGWPVQTVSPSAWLRLPEAHEGLAEIAREYYGATKLLPVAGSQAAIQALPRLRTRSRVGVLAPGYAEHAHAWRMAGHKVILLSRDELASHLHSLDVLVLIHPNNPSGTRFSFDELEGYRTQLANKGGWLVVDEAFMDATPECSLAPRISEDGLIVLRSLGKFFGLAGARVGFVCAQESVLTPLEELLGPWTLSGPSCEVAKAALQDTCWQKEAIRRLTLQSERLRLMLSQAGLTPTGGTPLFQWVMTNNARHIHHKLAESGILTRLFLEPQSIRFGLPRGEQDWARLASALPSQLAF